MRSRAGWWRRSESVYYLLSVGITAAVTTVMLRLWRATWSVPFYYSGDAVSTAAIFHTTMQTGWFASAPQLGAPYGQHYYDYPFSDLLHPLVVKVLGVFTDQVGVVMNVYYVLGFLLCGPTALWFFRRCGLSGWISISLSVLYAVAPYHFMRNENHLFLAMYFAVPLAMGVVLTAIRGEPLWGRRPGAGPAGSVLTGRGAGTVVILTLITLDGAYYGAFTALLLAASGIAALVRTRDWRRFLGVAAAGAVLLTVFFGAMLPGLAYQAVHGRNPAAFVRLPQDAERYALKFASLILPATGEPVGFLAHLRATYDATFPFPGERPALGVVAAIGFLVLMVVPLLGVARAFDPRGAGAAPLARRRLLNQLSLLTWVSFLLATRGGISSLFSLFLTSSIRSWNRLSIFLALFGLAAVGVLIDALSSRLSARSAVSSAGGRRTMTLAAVVLLMGCLDQNLSIAVPAYRSTAAAWKSDQHFVDELQARLPADAMIFQLPYQEFPESPAQNGVPDSDQLRLYLHSSTLRWSGGGIKGRPQTNWPGPVSAEKPSTMINDLAVMGFAGIVIDRRAAGSSGSVLDSKLSPLLGRPVLTSPDRRYWFFTLDVAASRVILSMTLAQRVARSAQILNSGGKS